MRNSRRLFRSVCEAPNAFDSKQALRAIVSSCLISPVTTAQGRGYNRYSTRFASTAGPRIPKQAVKDATPGSLIRYHGIGSSHATAHRKIISGGSESAPDTNSGSQRSGLSHGPSQTPAPNAREEDDALTQVEIPRRSAENKRGKSDVLEPRRESTVQVRDPTSGLRKWGTRAVAGVLPGSKIYPALVQLHEHKHEMLDARRQFDGGELDAHSRNLSPIPYNPELRRHLMSAKTLIQELRDCPDHEYKQLLWDHIAPIVRYVGRPIGLDSDRAIPSSPIPWAMEDHTGLRGHQLLDEEIRRLEEYLKFSDAEIAARKAVAQEFITTCAKAERVKTPYMLEQFGSEITGLALPDSDLDFRASRRTHYRESKRRLSSKPKKASDTPNLEWYYIMVRDVRNIATALDMSGKFGLVTARTDTAYPIINCQHVETGIDIQLSWGGTPRGQERAISQNLAQFERLRVVYQIIRLALAARSLSDVFHGGLGSYGLFCLVAAIFHRKVDPEQLHGYRAYAATHPLTEAIRSIASEPSILKRFIVGPDSWPDRFPDGPEDDHKDLKAESMQGRDEKTGLRNLEPLLHHCPSIIDPANPRNDLGAKAYAYLYIRSTMRLESERLITSLMILDEAVDGKPGGWRECKLYHTPDPNVKSLLLPLIGNYHDRVGPLRERVEAYGRKVLSGAIVPPVHSKRAPPEEDLAAGHWRAVATDPTPPVSNSTTEHWRRVAFERSESNEEVIGSKPAPDVDAAQFDIMEEDETVSDAHEEATPPSNEEQQQPTPSAEAIVQPEAKEATSTPS